MSRDSLMDSGYLSDVVTMDTILQPDKQGWLLDMASGKKRWCVLADILLCIFSDQDDQKPEHVLMMPGQCIRARVFNTAKPDRILDAWHPGKTASGFTRFQVVVECPEKSETFIFGAESQDELDDWVGMLTMASKLDGKVFDDSDLEDNEYLQDILQSSTDNKVAGSRHSSLSSNQEELHSPVSSGLMPNTIGHTGSKSSPNSPQNQRSVHSKVKKSNSFSSKKLDFGGKMDGVVNGNISYEPMPSRDEPSRSRSTARKGHPRTKSIDTLIEDDVSAERSPRRTHSADRSRESIGKRIVRRANSFKDKVFGAKTKVELVDDDKLQKEDIILAGYLQYKHLLKWSKLWCIVSNGTFTGYRSKDASGKPVVSLPLNECAVQSVERDRSRKMFVFKLCQLYAKSTYLAAEELEDFNRWMNCLRRHTDPYDASGMLQRPHSAEPSTRPSKPSLYNKLSSSSLPYGDLKMGSKKGAIRPSSPFQDMQGPMSSSWNEQYAKALPRSPSSSSFGSSSAASSGSITIDLDHKPNDIYDSTDESAAHAKQQRHRNGPSKAKRVILPAHGIKETTSSTSSPASSPRTRQLRSLRSQLTVLPSRPVISSQTLPATQCPSGGDTDVMVYLDDAAGTQKTPPYQEEPSKSPRKLSRSFSEGSITVPESVKKNYMAKKKKVPTATLR